MANATSLANVLECVGACDVHGVSARDRCAHPASDPTSRRAFLSVAALLFAASTAATILWCASMSTMDAMPMPGGWTMSMTWMRMPGQTWLDASASFLGMWVVMMLAMMLPSLVPMLQRFRQTVTRQPAAAPHLDRLTLLAGAGYFFVWTLAGAAVFPLGVALAEIEMRQPMLSRAVPITVGIVVLLAGAFQLTTWKAHQLACCQDAPPCDHSLRADIRTAWQQGLRLGLQCGRCCANLMAIPLVIGVMDLRAMAVVSAAITLERLAPTNTRAAQAIGVVAMGVGLLLIARAAGAGI